jgi:hypothetical protein
MAYYIFLKSLRSLEEFRKKPHVKIPPNFPCAHFQSLGKFQNPISNLKIFLLYFRSGHPYRPTRPLAQPAPASLSSPAGRSPQVGPSRSAHARHWRNCRNTLSYLIHAFHSRCLLSTHRWHRGPLVSLIFSTASIDPGRESSAPPLSAPPAPRLGCRQAFTAATSSFPPLIPFKPSLNEP